MSTTSKPWFYSDHQQFSKAKTRRRKRLEFKTTFQIYLLICTFLLFATTDLSSYLNSSNTFSSSSSSSIFLLTSASFVVAFSSSSSSSSSSGVDAYFDSSSSSTGTGNGGFQLQHHQQQMCPPVCSCIWKGGKQTATCDRRGLASVPVGLVSTTQVVDLSGNSLHALPANVFLERGLINLQRIYLVDCQLRDISAETFVKLSNLVELDLSNNSLTAVPSKSFFEAPSLRRLSLAGNRLREVRSAAFSQPRSLGGP
ncbi:Leucine rich repeat C-terminal domain [Tyrophagus putrescentiae]|nr:Leucine rich repeat C-terminal domain [Tyrophagus putrescentiae]